MLSFVCFDFWPWECIICWKQKPATYHSLKPFAAIIIFYPYHMQQQKYPLSISLFWGKLFWPHFSCESFNSKIRTWTTSLLGPEPLPPPPTLFPQASLPHLFPTLPHTTPLPSGSIVHTLGSSLPTLLSSHSWFLQQCSYQCPGLPCSPILQSHKVCQLPLPHPNWLEI